MKKFLKSKAFHWAAISLSVLLLIFLGQKFYKSYQIEKEIEGLQEDIVSIEQSNKEVLDLINYFKTPEFKERQARSLLSLQKPGEFAVTLPLREDGDFDQAADESEVTEPSNLFKWWEYFFGNETI